MPIPSSHHGQKVLQNHKKPPITSLAHEIHPELPDGACLSHLIPVTPLFSLPDPSPTLHFTHTEFPAALRMYHGPSHFWPSLMLFALPSSQDVCQSNSYLCFSFSPPPRSLLGPLFILPLPSHLAPAQADSRIPSLCSPAGIEHVETEVFYLYSLLYVDLSETINCTFHL
uniref:Uncharacterized protein n=1 Tax=Myotis myotis TaxID=51298 RepID=A0A7J7Z5C5_MYOMY|nr:hypothetical protein mMyoMyo1_010613 [Myotis myotis]